MTSSNDPLVSYSIDSPNNPSQAGLFESLEDISAMSGILTRSLTIASQDVWDDILVANSLALVASETPSIALVVVPLEA